MEEDFNNFTEKPRQGLDLEESQFTLKSKYEQLLANKKKAKGFRAFNLNNHILEAIKSIGWKFPTPIQRKTIPDVISGFNVIAHSRTGSGKTAAFLIPILNKLKEHSKIVGTRCLIVSPTRELAHQTLANCKKLGRFMNLRFTLLVGGNELEGQFEKLAQNPDIIIATPGRVMHHLNEGSLSLKKVEILAIDEADKIFDLNFEEQVRLILRSCPASRQVLLFSATIPQQLAQFMKTGIREYKLINIDEENKIPDKLKIHLIHTRSEEKKFALISLLTSNSIINRFKESTLIFVSTKYHCEYLHEFLKFWKISSLFIYGQMDQGLRDTNLDKFRKGQVKVLVVTDVAARGLDIPMLDNVINYDFPDSVKLFIHRVGRTARAGKEGRVFNLVTPPEMAYFFDIKVNLGKQLLVITKSSPEEIKKSIEDFSLISFGSVPQTVLNSIKEIKEDMINYKVDMEALEDSCHKAYGKALAFRQKPSKFGIKQSKKLINNEAIAPHPIFHKMINGKHSNMQDEIDKSNFLTSLKNFKPKESYFERVNETNVKEDIIKDFKRKTEIFKKRKEFEKKKEKLLQERLDYDIDDENETKDDFNHEYNEDMINREYDKNDNQFLGKKVKRSKIRNFKNNPHFVSETKSNSESLWGDEKPLTMDELTLNIAPDDDNLTNKKKLVWDPNRKNFVRGNVDKSGKILKKNESGVKIKKNDKNPRAYNTWKKKNKTRIQNVGEMENEKVVSGADTMFKERKFQKMQRSNEKNDPKPKMIKNELKTFDQLLKAKKDTFKQHSKKDFSKKDAKYREIREKSHLNRKSQVLIRKRTSGKKRR